MKDEYFNDYREAIKCRDQHLEVGRTAELIPRLRCGNVLYRVRSQEPEIKPTDGE